MSIHMPTIMSGYLPGNVCDNCTGIMLEYMQNKKLSVRDKSINMKNIIFIISLILYRIYYILYIISYIYIYLMNKVDIYIIYI